MTVSSSILIKTRSAGGYLQRLCKHFAHKTDVEFTEESGWIAFDFGRAYLLADADGLMVRGVAENAEDLARLKRVIVSHLERFAFREALTIDWEI